MEAPRDQYARETTPAKLKAIAEAVQVRETQYPTHIWLGQWYSMAEGRALFRVFPHNILFPGVFLAATVLAANTMGDGLRDSLDPRLRNRL